MSKVPSMLDDKRDIHEVHFLGADAGFFAVGRNGIEKIVAYGEPGHMALIPWIAVYKEGQIVYRFPAGQVQICYVVIKQNLAVDVNQQQVQP